MFPLIGIILFVIVVYAIATYNGLVTIKTRIKASIQEIGNQLKRQIDLIPNLTSSVKGYMKHEKDIFKELTEARKIVDQATKLGSADKLLKASERMEQALAPIRVVFESTPQLQAAVPVSRLMDELRDTADKVMYSRRTLIDLTADYNAKISVFPSKLIASIFGFKAEAGLKTAESGDFIEVSTAETETPKVDL